jgi:hypothetical protein
MLRDFTRNIRLSGERRYFFAFLFSLLSFILAEPAWGVQSHGGPEGLVAHQLGHLLFVGGMVFLLIRSRLDQPGWKSFRGFLWFIIGWNVLTFAGHLVEIAIPDGNFLTSGSVITGFLIDSAAALFVYLAQLDHFLLLPALLLLANALKQWVNSSEEP